MRFTPFSSPHGRGWMCAGILLGLLAVFSSTHGEEGYARVVKVETVLKTSVDGTRRPIQYPRGEPELTGVVVEIPPGKDTGWHIHPTPCVAYILEGEVSVELEGGEVRSFKAGESFAEVVNVRHCGFNHSSKPVRILMFAIGEKGTPISRRMEK